MAALRRPPGLGLYNRLRISGRHDYFELPDWNVYVEGGRAITFTLPNEAWNHLEFQGTANGTLTFIPTTGAEHLLAARRRRAGTHPRTTSPPSRAASCVSTMRCR